MTSILIHSKRKRKKLQKKCLSVAIKQKVAVAWRVPKPYVGGRQSKGRIFESLPHFYSHHNHLLLDSIRRCWPFALTQCKFFLFLTCSESAVRSPVTSGVRTSLLTHTLRTEMSNHNVGVWVWGQIQPILCVLMLKVMIGWRCTHS